MRVEYKSARGIDVIDIETRLLEQGDIYINGEIDRELVQSVAQQLLYLARKYPDREIRIHYSSPGGSLKDGLVLQNIITSIEVPIVSIAEGPCYSMCALLFISGKKRYMLKDGELMLHEPLINSVSGSTTVIKQISDAMVIYRERVHRIVAEITNKPIAEIEKDLNHDRYFNANEAIEYGLADKIIGYQEVVSAIDNNN